MITPLFIQRRRNKGKPPLKLYWWRYRYPEKLNFGDEITQYIIQKVWGRECVWTSPKECELAGAGSIIEILQEHSGDNSIKVWGSGFIKQGSANDKNNLHFYAVRGPLSKGRIRASREVALGDPGILSSVVFKPAAKKTHKVGIVFHYVDRDNPELKEIKDNPQYRLIDPLQTPEKVAKDITSCELVLSSSLHGLIVADSFKIPNYWMPLSDGVTGGGYKFRDYYASTNRGLVRWSPSILKDDELIVEAIKTYVPISHLKRMQRKLIKSFPY